MSGKRRMRESRFIVFTDLDGTLLDQESYSYEPALPALSHLKERGIPVIICTSKTRAEIEVIRRKMGNSHPFISENGGAVFIPREYFGHHLSYDTERNGYLVIEFGIPYALLRKALDDIKALHPGKIKGFGDMTIEEVAGISGLTLEEAGLAKERDYDEPFLLEDKNLENDIQEIIKSMNLRITRGGQFYHLTGNNDKGRAASVLGNIYRKEWGDLQTIGLGDSQNDLPMLSAVDFPVLVQKSDRSYDSSVKLRHLILARGAGPSGWSDAILRLIPRISQD